MKKYQSNNEDSSCTFVISSDLEMLWKVLNGIVSERVSLSFQFCVDGVPEEVLNTNEKLNTFSKTVGIFYQPCHIHHSFVSHLLFYIILCSVLL